MTVRKGKMEGEKEERGAGGAGRVKALALGLNILKYCLPTLSHKIHHYAVNKDCLS